MKDVDSTLELIEDEELQKAVAFEITMHGEMEDEELLSRLSCVQEVYCGDTA